MRGRPKEEDPRDIIYKIRLNSEENEMLAYVSEWTGQAKSKVFRKALRDYYAAVKTEERHVNLEMEAAGWPLDHISLQRTIKCPYDDCGEEFVVDFSTVSDEQESDGPMGYRCEHRFDTDEIECPECHRRIHTVGLISEYPVGAFENEKITVNKTTTDDA